MGHVDAARIVVDAQVVEIFPTSRRLRQRAADWFEANGLAEMVGGAAYLIELANTKTRLVIRRGLSLLLEKLCNFDSMSSVT